MYFEGVLFVISVKAGPLLTFTVESSHAAVTHSSLPTVILNSKLEGLPRGQVPPFITQCYLGFLKKQTNPTKNKAKKHQTIFHIKTITTSFCLLFVVTDVSFGCLNNLRCFWISVSASRVVNSCQLYLLHVDHAISLDKVAILAPNNDPFSTVSW